jgi:hypothetical protein
VPAEGQYSFDNYLTVVHISDKSSQYNFEFKFGQKTDQPASYDDVLNRILIDHDGNQLKKIVKWCSKREDQISHGL